MSLSCLMVHTVNHYALASTTRDGSAGKVQHYATTPTNANVPCNFQHDMSDVADGSGGVMYRKQVQTATLFMIDGTVWNAIATKDRITFGGINYHVTGKQDLVDLARVYAMTLMQEQESST
jgi:hypothetical protein